MLFQFHEEVGGRYRGAAHTAGGAGGEGCGASRPLLLPQPRLMSRQRFPLLMLQERLLLLGHPKLVVQRRLGGQVDRLAVRLRSNKLGRRRVLEHGVVASAAANAFSMSTSRGAATAPKWRHRIRASRRRRLAAAPVGCTRPRAPPAAAHTNAAAHPAGLACPALPLAGWAEGVLCSRHRCEGDDTQAVLGLKVAVMEGGGWGGEKGKHGEKSPMKVAVMGGGGGG